MSNQATHCYVKFNNLCATSRSKGCTLLNINISKGTRCRKLDFELLGAKSECLKIWSKGRFLRFHIFWNLQYIFYYLLEGFNLKMAFSCYLHQYFAQIHIFLRALFSESTFHQSVMISSMKFPYLENAMSYFKIFCTEIELKEQPFQKYQKFNFELRIQLVPFDVFVQIHASSM